MIEIKVYGLGAIGNVPSWMYGVILTQKTRQVQKIATLLLVGYVALVFCSAVVFREEGADRGMNLVPLSSYFCIGENSYLWEVSAINLLNIAMFIPVGFLLKCGLRSLTWKQTFLAGTILSTAIELSQFILSKGLCEVDDLIHNVLGCMVGYATATLTINVLRPLTKKTTIRIE